MAEPFSGATPASCSRRMVQTNAARRLCMCARMCVSDCVCMCTQASMLRELTYLYVCKCACMSEAFRDGAGTLLSLAPNLLRSQPRASSQVESCLLGCETSWFII